MAREDYLDHLASVPLFRGMTRKELRDIAKATVEVNIDEGSEFVTQGDVGREAFVLVEGTADVIRNGKKIAQMQPGDCVGELALLDHGPRTASVVAATSVTALVLGPREFTGVLDQVPTLNHKLLGALASRVRELDARTFG
jgi:CRP/FNR family transcriptional regulator, cyclic AMP receptor protein